MAEPLFDAPYVAVSVTSAEAAAAIKPVRSTMRDRVLKAIVTHGPLTDQEIAYVTGMPENSVRPRRVELARLGKIEPCGMTRTSSGRRARAWVAS